MNIISIITLIIFVIEVLVVSSNHNYETKVDYRLELYRLAYNIHSNINNNDSNNNTSNNAKIHLIRVPKASSSSLSAVARRIVGCLPPG